VRAEAAEVGPGLPLWLFADSTNVMKREVFEAAGGTIIRRFYRMLIDLTVTPLPAMPSLPDGVAIRPMAPTEADRRTVHRIVDTAFIDHFGHEPHAYEGWVRGVLNGSCPDPSLYWLATVDGEPAATVYNSARATTGHVDTLGTLREFRGKGLGRALLLTSFAELASRGFTRITLGVDATSVTGALALYESVGMHIENEGWRYEFAPLP
jgi:mycothiol synthase